MSTMSRLATRDVTLTADEMRVVYSALLMYVVNERLAIKRVSQDLGAKLIEAMSRDVATAEEVLSLFESTNEAQNVNSR